MKWPKFMSRISHLCKSKKYPLGTVNFVLHWLSSNFGNFLENDFFSLSRMNGVNLKLCDIKFCTGCILSEKFIEGWKFAYSSILLWFLLVISAWDEKFFSSFISLFGNFLVYDFWTPPPPINFVHGCDRKFPNLT